MLNNLVFKSAKSIKNINNTTLKNFASKAAPAPSQASMTARFHDIYIKELEKLKKTK
jgi:hypothetical protein